jgi:hypothetical protein
MPFIPYDPDEHGILHRTDWRFRDHLGEAAISAVEHLPTRILFFPTAYTDDKGDTTFGTSWSGPDDLAADADTIAHLAQHAMRYYCLHLTTTPQAEIQDHIAKTPKL